MPIAAPHRAKAIVEALGGIWRGTRGECRCPAHDDHGPSLSVRLKDVPTLRCSDPLPPRSHILVRAYVGRALSGCGLLCRSELGRRRWRRPSWITRE